MLGMTCAGNSEVQKADMACGANNEAKKVLLADVAVLKFHRGHKTTSRRTKAIPELICDSSGTAGCPTGRECQFSNAICKNQGIGEDGYPVWACTASDVPNSISLGHVEVSCEGYSDKHDPYVLVGSCSLTYTLDGSVSQGNPVAFVLIVFTFFCCSFCLNKLNKSKAVRAPPPAYEAVSSGQMRLDITAEPVMATAVPLVDEDRGDSRGKSTGGDKDAKEVVYHDLPAAVAVEATTVKVSRATPATTAADSPSSRKGDDALPEGWETRVDPGSGDTYYADHGARITTWIHPRTQQPTEQHSFLQSQHQMRGTSDNSSEWRRRDRWGGGGGGYSGGRRSKGGGVAVRAPLLGEARLDSGRRRGVAKVFFRG